MQFLHAESYGRSSPKKARDRRWTVREVIAELVREPGAHPHVVVPKLPQILYGDQPIAVERMLMEAAERAIDPIGRRLRKDAQILVAGVASYPVPVDRLTDADWLAYRRWERDTIAWLYRQYGDRLRSVVRHMDEKYPHLHWLAVPDLAAGERVEAIDPGKRAMAAAKAEGVKQKRVIDQRYRAAMRAWQDDYWQKVGAKHRLRRSGPQRQRLTRTAWHIEQEVVQKVMRIAAERDFQKEENTRLVEENGCLRGALDAMMKRARSVVRALLQVETQGLGSEAPSWLDKTDWDRVLGKVRAFVAVTALRRSLPPTEALAPIRREIGRAR